MSFPTTRQQCLSFPKLSVRSSKLALFFTSGAVKGNLFFVGQGNLVGQEPPQLLQAARDFSQRTLDCKPQDWKIRTWCIKKWGSLWSKQAGPLMLQKQTGQKAEPQGAMEKTPGHTGKRPRAGSNFRPGQRGMLLLTNLFGGLVWFAFCGCCCCF